MSIRIQNRQGFTLTEVLLGLVMLAFSVLAVAGMQVASIKGNAFSQNLTQASVLAQNRMETLRSLDFTNALFNANGDYNDIQDGIFQGRYQIVRVGGYVTIRYTVTWPDKGNTRSVAFSTIKSR